MFLEVVPCIYLFGILHSCYGVIMDPEHRPISPDRANHHYTEGNINNLGTGGFTETFQTCLRDNSGAGNLFPCFNKGAIAGIVGASGTDALDISDGVSLERNPDDKGPRMVIPVDLMNPLDFRSVLDAASMLMKQRSLRYDMSMLQPGLIMRVGPTLDGTGLLEFVMDRQISHYDDRSSGFSTGRLIARQVLLPLLLGFKLPLVTLVPLILGALILIAKKAFIISKVAMVISGILGISAYYGGHDRPHGGVFNRPGPFNQGFNDQVHEPLQAHSMISESILNPFGFRGGNQMFRGVNAPREAGEIIPNEKRNFVWEKKE